MSESFSDPKRVPNLNISNNSIPNILHLKEQNTSGLMLSTGYGGGTANMERQSLTGLSQALLSPTLATPYTQLVPKQKITPSITDLFDESIAIHPSGASLYDRGKVFSKFGFKKFYYFGSKYKLSYTRKIQNNPNVSDYSSYAQTLKELKKQHKGSRFIQLSTIQNHMPYNNYYKVNKFKASGQAVTDQNNRRQIETYIQGLNYTDDATLKFINSLNQLHEPVTVVWYGDHLASLYNSDSMQKYGLSLHETDYFVYNNKIKNKMNKQKIISPYSFPTLALDSINSKITPYYALIADVTKKVPAMTVDPSHSKLNQVNGSRIFVNKNGKKVKESDLTKKQKQILHDYQLIQYDLTAGKQYSGKWAEQKISK